MDAISGSENNAFIRAYGKPESTVSASKSTLPLDTAKVRLIDISDLSDRAASSTEDIRPEAVKRAQALLSDPNWPNDNDLEGLAEKLFSTEDFAG